MSAIEELELLEKKLTKKRSSYDQEKGALDMAKKTLEEIYGKSFKMPSVEKDLQKKESHVEDLEKELEAVVGTLKGMLGEFDDE